MGEPSEPIEHEHTERERRVIDATVEVFNAFVDLEREEGATHPSHTRDVADAVHDVQRIVAMRLAQRVDPMTWPPKPAPAWLERFRELGIDDRTGEP